MEQSRENYDRLAAEAENAKADDERYAFTDRYIHKADYVGDWKGYGNPFDMRMNKAFFRALGFDQGGAEKRLQKYLEEGHAEALALNEEYEKLKKDVFRAQKDFQEYSLAHQGIVDETTPSWQQLKERIDQATEALRLFKIEKLGQTPEQEAAEAA